MREVVQHAEGEDQLEVANLVHPGSVKIQHERRPPAGLHGLDVLGPTVRRGDVKPEGGESITQAAEPSPDFQDPHPAPPFDVDMSE